MMRDGFPKGQFQSSHSDAGQHPIPSTDHAIERQTMGRPNIVSPTRKGASPGLIAVSCLRSCPNVGIGRHT